MSSTMTYKGQTARVEFDARDNLLVGRLVGITDVVSFQGVWGQRGLGSGLEFC